MMRQQEEVGASLGLGGEVLELGQIPEICLQVHLASWQNASQRHPAMFMQTYKISVAVVHNTQDFKYSRCSLQKNYS